MSGYKSRLSSWNPRGYTTPSLIRTVDDILRSLRLHLFAYLTKQKGGLEGKKVALYSSRWVAVLYSLLHVIPIAVCVLLLDLNFRTRFIGPLTTQSLTAFQFAAKFLEILIQASITAIMLAVVRIQILGRTSIPFGGLIAPFRTTDPSLLWSLELWGLFSSFRVKEWRQIIVTLLAPISVVLAAVIGPSSAVLMIPRLISHPSFSTLNLLDPVDVLYPTSVMLNGTKILDESEYKSTYSQVVRRWSDRKATVVDSIGSRDLWYTARTVSTQEYTYLPASIATMDTALSRLFFHTGTDPAWTITVRMAQPYVYEECWRTETLLNSTHDEYLSFGPAKQYLDNFVPSAWLEPNASISISHDDSFSIMPTTQYYGDPSVYNTIVFSRPPTAHSNTSLLVVWALTDTTGGTRHSHACTIDANWVVRSASRRSQATSHSSDDILISEDDDPEHLFSALDNKRRILLSPAWMVELFLPFLDNPTDYSTFPGFAIQLVALALSYVPQSAMYTTKPSLQVEFNGFIDGKPVNWTSLTDPQTKAVNLYIADNHLKDHYSAVWVATETQDWTDPSTLSQITVHSYNNGYGYDTSSTTVRLSLAVVIFYLVMVITYLIYSITVGLAGSSWDSVADLIVLAANSEKNHSLQNTSAGISTLGTYRQRVNIRADANDALQLVFSPNPGDKRYRLIEKNKEY